MSVHSCPSSPCPLCHVAPAPQPEPAKCSSVYESKRWGTLYCHRAVGHEGEHGQSLKFPGTVTWPTQIPIGVPPPATPDAPADCIECHRPRSWWWHGSYDEHHPNVHPFNAGKPAAPKLGAGDALCKHQIVDGTAGGGSVCYFCRRTLCNEAGCSDSPAPSGNWCAVHQWKADATEQLRASNAALTTEVAGLRERLGEAERALRNIRDVTGPFLGAGKPSSLICRTIDEHAKNGLSNTGAGAK